MKVHRVIAVYDKVKDNLIEDFKIDNFSLDELRKFFPDREDDPELNKVYLITEEQLVEFIKLIPKLSEFDFNIVEFYLECFQE